jgi:CDP-glycerol glycerophosphotransferase (TagB/SpsB family)
LADIYTILPFTDVLITDYSSVYTDFLMMNKEIILFVFDYNDYVKGCCELKDYDKYYLGKKAYSFTQLLDIISTGEDCHVPQDQYSRLMDFFWSNNESTINIVEEIKIRIKY